MLFKERADQKNQVSRCSLNLPDILLVKRVILYDVKYVSKKQAKHCSFANLKFSKRHSDCPMQQITAVPCTVHTPVQSTSIYRTICSNQCFIQSRKNNYRIFSDFTRENRATSGHMQQERQVFTEQQNDCQVQGQQHCPPGENRQG